jgi:hypothetical protein
MIIKKFTYNLEKTWDNFVNKQYFGTIYHTRQFINYHPNDRFIDESILIYDNDELICVLPACKRGDGYFSYTGATYGGPVISKKYTKIKYLKNIIDKIFDYFDNKIEFRLANDIYFDESSYTLYFLLSQKLKVYPELSWYIKTDDDFIENITNKKNKSRLRKSIADESITCTFYDNEKDYIEFYKILQKNLENNHDSNPTHSLEEFLKVKNVLEDKQRLYLVKQNENILGGVYVLKTTNQCWYTFYISRNIDLDKVNSSVSYLMYQIAIDAKKENVKYIDYGISTEEKGKLINEGLSDFKESSLGGISNYRYLYLRK